MLHHMFYFGVVLPTALVIVFFILFLIAWYKCNLRQRFTRRPYHKNSTGSHNSTQSSLVTTSTGFPYPNGPPSKDYWEIDVERDTNVDMKESKYIPGDFSINSEDWIYMSQDVAEKVTKMNRTTNAHVHVWSTASSADTTSVDSTNSCTKPCLDGHSEKNVNSNRSSPESVSQEPDTLPLNVQNHREWNRTPDLSQYPSASPRFEFIATSDYHCSPYAITNLLHPPPAIRV